LVEIKGTLYCSIPKQEAERLGWKKGTKLYVGRIDAVQRKLAIEEMSAVNLNK